MGVLTKYDQIEPIYLPQSNVTIFLYSLYNVDMDRDADVSDAHSASITKVEVCKVNQYLCIYRFWFSIPTGVLAKRVSEQGSGPKTASIRPLSDQKQSTGVPKQ
jgi:hypothetical protein